MKRILTAFLLLILVISEKEVSAQRIYGALSAGLNLSQIDGDEIYGFHHAGFNVGPSVIIPFTKNKKWTVTLELDYSQLGSYQKHGPSDSITAITPYRKINLDYAVVPVLVHFTDKNIISGGLGFSYGRLVNAKQWERDSLVVNGLSGPYSKNDWDVLIDVKLKLYQRLWFNFRYSYSMAKIITYHWKNEANQEWDRNGYNNVLTFRLTYVFNQPIVKKNGKAKTGGAK